MEILNFISINLVSKPLKKINPKHQPEGKTTYKWLPF